MRHERFATTERYIHVGEDQLRSLWKTKNPLTGRRSAPDVHAVGRAILADLAAVLPG